MNDEHQAIEAFLDGRTIAVVGASRSRYKFGHQVLRCLLDHDYDAIPVNPSATRVAGIETVEEMDAYPWPSANWFDYAALPERIREVGEDGKYAIVSGLTYPFERLTWMIRQTPICAR